jgi:hypothetical protein
MKSAYVDLFGKTGGGGGFVRFDHKFSNSPISTLNVDASNIQVHVCPYGVLESDEKVNGVHILKNHRTMQKTKILHLKIDNTKLVIVILLFNICFPISSLTSEVIRAGSTSGRSIIDITHLVDQDGSRKIITSYCNFWDFFFFLQLLDHIYHQLSEFLLLLPNWRSFLLNGSFFWKATSSSAFLF